MTIVITFRLFERLILIAENEFSRLFLSLQYDAKEHADDQCYGNYTPSRDYLEPQPRWAI